MLPWRTSARQGQVSATGFEQLHGALSPGKQHELRERQSALVMSDNEDDGESGGRDSDRPGALKSAVGLHSMSPADDTGARPGRCRMPVTSVG